MKQFTKYPKILLNMWSQQRVVTSHNPRITQCYGNVLGVNSQTFLCKTYEITYVLLTITPEIVDPRAHVSDKHLVNTQVRYNVDVSGSYVPCVSRHLALLGTTDGAIEIGNNVILWSVYDCV